MHDSSARLHESPRARLRLVHVGPYEAPRGKDFPPHSHKTWELIYYRAGAIESVVGAEVHQGHPAALVAIPPRVVHAERALTAYSNFYLMIDAPEHHPWPRVCYDDEHATLGQVCGAIVREWRAQLPEQAHMLDLLLDQLDLLLRRARAQDQLPGGERLVREAERLLQERCNGRVRIGGIADELGVSPSSLRAQFARLRSQTPTAYLQAMRVEHALAAIRHSNAPLEAIAGACGYDSASHLSRHVKRATGTSPGALRTVRAPVDGEPRRTGAG